MLTRNAVDTARARAREYFARAGLILTAEEAENIEVADFGLNDLEVTGLQLVTYVNTTRVCAKELVLFPHQTCPEHRHPPIKRESGKEETFRCRWGKVFLYTGDLPGNRETAQCQPPAARTHSYTVWHEVVLEPGQQYTIPPNTLHWFQAGDHGAVVSEFSTRSRDEMDKYTDKQIDRVPRTTD
jgi:D-lyxose ketol-isomerase